MSNVINFRGALAALEARRADKAQYAALQGFAASPLGDAGAGPQTYTSMEVKPQAQPVPVRSVQSRLVNLGFKIAVDGRDGPQTKRAIAAFQRAVGIPANSVVDAFTWNWMNTVNPADVIAVAAEFSAAESPTRARPAATPIVPQVLAPVGAPFLDRAKMWLMRPGEPMYKKPAVWIGGIAALITASILLRSVSDKPTPPK